MAHVSHLSPEQRDVVTQAVTAAETGTNGEIVTIVADRSDAYHDVALHYVIAAMLLVAALAAVQPAWLEWLVGLVDGGWTLGPDLRGLFFALLIVEAIVFPILNGVLRFMPLRLALTPRATRARRVRQRAVQYFRVGAERRTAQRVGILLFLSRDERMAEIVADEAIHQAVPAERWGDAMLALIDEVRDGRVAEGMAAAVAQIGAILGETFPKTADNPNELPDRLIEL
ncbi:hypothetical protein EAH87_04200 [Sphingomonas koreensis]|nr:hypothetical protein EAH87_04200 [Sphingomonas koreensis]